MTALSLPQHPLRHRLNNELHARPPMALGAAEWVSYLALMHEGSTAEGEESHLHRLCEVMGANFCPLIDGDHWVMASGRLRLKWERHTEFSSYTFFLERGPEDGPGTTALAAVPQDWLNAIPGTIIAASHIEVRTVEGDPLDDIHAATACASDQVVATSVGGGAAWVVSDYRLHDGFSHFLLLDEGLTRRQSGRTVQRLLEIETYRILALLAFPIAKETNRFITEAETELSNLMENLGEARSPEDERKLLAALTKLAAEVERSSSHTAYRFSAAEAYYTLVQQRIRDLRESRLGGFPPIQEFMDRRLTPAIKTCLAVAQRQSKLAERIARKSALLRTRVDVELERQNQQLLAQMNTRAKLQLRLQETVEGLSVVVLTYYGSSLVHHLAEAVHQSLHLGPAPEVTTAISIPIIAALVAWGTHRMRKKLEAEDGGH